MAYDRYATQFTDKDGNVYGVMDEEAREDKAPVICPTASGAIASFPDGADGLKLRELNVAVEPVQDLHGYDAPWPAGGGKNLLEITATSVTKNGVTYTVNKDNAGNVRSVSISGTSTGTSELMLNSAVALPNGGIVTGAESHATSNASYRIRIGKTSDNSFVVNELGSGANIPALSGDTYNVKILIDGVGVTFNYTLYPMIRLSTVSDATFAPYSNICPISGHTGAVVTRTGVNVWDEEWENGYFSSTGEASASSTAIRSKNFCACYPDTDYYAHIGHSSAMVFIYWYDASQNFIRRTNGRNAVHHAPANARFFKTCTNADYDTTYSNDISINYPSSDTSYHPGQVQTAEIELPSAAGTIYGGNLTLHQDGSGEVVVDRASVDLGTLNWTYASPNYFYADMPSDSCSPVAGGSQGICSNYIRIYGSTSALLASDKCFTYNNTGFTASKRIFIRDTAYSDATAFKAALTATNARLVYELAIPVAISISASQITTLLGLNNIFADCGDVSITYPADSKLYIDNKIAQAIAAALNA